MMQTNDPKKFRNRYRIPSARVCTAGWAHLFGEVRSGRMVLSPLGKIVQQEWEKSFEIRQELICDIYVIMPNHIHAIVRIVAAETHGPTVETHGPTVAVETHGRASLAEIHFIVRGRVQIRGHQTHQRITPHPRRGRMATPVSRPYHPRRPIVRTHRRLHRRQPGPMAGRPLFPGA